ncbi:MAG: hypothetical protein QNJ40_06140 [Xanthomonadales bacterium]|nr:hypothetical protein [Xanthomonadales bacterium]
MRYKGVMGTRPSTLHKLLLASCLACCAPLAQAGDSVFEATPLEFGEALFDSFSSSSDVNWYVINFDANTRVDLPWQFTMGEAQCGNCPPNTVCTLVFNPFCPEYGLRATLYEADILTNPAAQPIFDLNSCDSFEQGFEQDEVNQPSGGTEGLRFLRVEDCVKNATGPEPGYFLYAERTFRTLTFPQLGFLAGRVYDESTNAGIIGAFVLTDLNTASVSGPGDMENPVGTYRMGLDPDVDFEVTVINDFYEEATVQVPGVVAAATTTVDIPLTPVGRIFRGGFER